MYYRRVTNHCHDTLQEAEQFIFEEERKTKEESIPEFAVKTQLLLKKAEEKERREKAEKEIQLQRLTSEEDNREKDNSMYIKAFTSYALPLPLRFILSTAHVHQYCPQRSCTRNKY